MSGALGINSSLIQSSQQLSEVEIIIMVLQTRKQAQWNKETKVTELGSDSAGV